MALLLGACQKRGGGAGDDMSKQVELTLYVIGGPQPNSPEMDAYLNEVLARKLPNTTFKWLYIDWAEFAQGKYELLFSSGESFDMVLAGDWAGLGGLAKRGAFMNLDNLYPKYAPNNYARQSQSAIRQATYNGHIYAVPNLEKNYTVWGFLYREDGLKLPGWDGKMETFGDLERYVKIVKANNPGVTGIHVGNDGNGELMRLWMENHGLYAVPGTARMWWLDLNSNSTEIIFWADHPTIPEFFAVVERLNAMDAWSKTALSDPAHNRWEQGLIGVNFGGFGHYRDWSIIYPWMGLRFKNMNKNVAYARFTESALGIPVTAKNPERALMFWDIATNNEEMWRAIFYGIEGRSYRVVEQDGKRLYERLFDTNGEAVYAFPQLWCIGVPEFYLPHFGAPPEISRWQAEFDEQIKEGQGAQKYQAFTYDSDVVEFENVVFTNVHREHFGPLSMGFVDVRTGLANYQQVVKTAGIEKIRAEIQKQLDAYLKSLE
jgi:ABC-type glycerol-3-phosphate transport system substrate-binding protein